MAKLLEAYQRHYNHYARLARENRLKDSDRPQYELAMQREKEGIVTPLAKPVAPGEKS